MKKIEIAEKSGCCFGVASAIKRAETELKKGGILYCLGDIVHNTQEVERLSKLGLITIDHEQFKKLKDVRVMLRAHGEPPETYELAKRNNIEIIDASCPVVLKLQKQIFNKYKETATAPADTQIVIYGKIGHAEVNGLIGQTNSSAIVIENTEDALKLDFTKNICLFSQTTKSLDGLKEITELIASHMVGDARFEYFDTICRQVSNRIPDIQKFALEYDVIFFVAGEKSSNGKILFAECKKSNPNSYFISSVQQIDPSIVSNPDISIGICGATSTPKWQMKEVEEYIEKLRKD